MWGNGREKGARKWSEMVENDGEIARNLSENGGIIVKNCGFFMSIL
jgi:hypothetical protein